MEFIQRDADKFTIHEFKKHMKTIEKEKVDLKSDVLKQFKFDFKHITGMWPKTAKFESEAERLESWQATAVIK